MSFEMLTEEVKDMTVEALQDRSESMRKGLNDGNGLLYVRPFLYQY